MRYIVLITLAICVVCAKLGSHECRARHAGGAGDAVVLQPPVTPAELDRGLAERAVAMHSAAANSPRSSARLYLGG